MNWSLVRTNDTPNRKVFVTYDGKKHHQLHRIDQFALEELRELPAELRASMLLSEPEMEDVLASIRRRKIAFILGAVKFRPYWRETGDDLRFDDDGVWAHVGIPLKWNTILHSLKKGTISAARLATLYDFFNNEVRWNEPERGEVLSTEQIRARRYYLHSRVKGIVRVAAAQKILYLPANSTQLGNKYLLELRDRFDYTIQMEIP